MQRSPHYPESHNLHGLVCEARKDYKSAATSYRIARHAINIGSLSIQSSLIKDVSINLARSLCKVHILEISSLMCSNHIMMFTNSYYLIQAGNAVDALQECENLKKEGSLSDFTIYLFRVLFYFKI